MNKSDGKPYNEASSVIRTYTESWNTVAGMSHKLNRNPNEDMSVLPFKENLYTEEPDKKKI